MCDNWHGRPGELGDECRDKVRSYRQRVDAGQVPREVPNSQGDHSRPVEVPQSRDARGVRLALGRADQPGGLGLCCRADPGTLCRGVSGNAFGRCFLGDPQVVVGTPLCDELLLSTSQFDLVLHLGLGNPAFLLHRDRSTTVRRAVCIGLDLLTGGRPQRLLHVGLRPDGDDSDTHDRDSGLGEPRIADETVENTRSHRRNTADQRIGQDRPSEQLKGVLLGGLGDQASELLERRGSPGAGVRIDSEVQAACRDGRVGDPEGHRRLHRDVLKVTGRRVEQQR